MKLHELTIRRRMIIPVLHTSGEGPSLSPIGDERRHSVCTVCCMSTLHRRIFVYVFWTGIEGEGGMAEVPYFQEKVFVKAFRRHNKRTESWFWRCMMVPAKGETSCHEGGEEYALTNLVVWPGRSQRWVLKISVRRQNSRNSTYGNQRLTNQMNRMMSLVMTAVNTAGIPITDHEEAKETTEVHSDLDLCTYADLFPTDTEREAYE